MTLKIWKYLDIVNQKNDLFIFQLSWWRRSIWKGIFFNLYHSKLFTVQNSMATPTLFWFSYRNWKSPEPLNDERREEREIIWALSTSLWSWYLDSGMIWWQLMMNERMAADIRWWLVTSDPGDPGAPPPSGDHHPVTTRSVTTSGDTQQTGNRSLQCLNLFIIIWNLSGSRKNDNCNDNFWLCDLLA